MMEKQFISSMYVLMHKNIYVCRMNISNEGDLSNIEFNDKTNNHLPFGTADNKMRFIKWWKDRAIPQTRFGAKTALQKLGYSSTSNMLLNNLALSLNDCYWIKPIELNITWEDVNLFANDFDDSFGTLTINEDATINFKNKTIFHSATSAGELQKKWCIDADGKRFMIKGNHGDSYQQSANEIFASELHKKQGFKNYVHYYKTDIDISKGRKGIGCLSYCFCNEKVESIPAWDILESKVKPNHISNFEHFKAICLENGIKESVFDDYFDYLIMSDFLLTNIDRHMNNIAVLRNPDTLKFIGLAPIYDTGNSMFFRDDTDSLKYKNIYKIEISSFVKKEVKMLKLVKNRMALNLDKTDLDFSIYTKIGHLDNGRVKELKRLFDLKKKILIDFQKGINPWHNAK